jgi:hypothetical protein
LRDEALGQTKIRIELTLTSGPAESAAVTAIQDDDLTVGAAFFQPIPQPRRLYRRRG